jgi:hypothetical protein
MGVVFKLRNGRHLGSDLEEEKGVPRELCFGDSREKELYKLCPRSRAARPSEWEFVLPKSEGSFGLDRGEGGLQTGTELKKQD